MRLLSSSMLMPFRPIVRSRYGLATTAIRLASGLSLVFLGLLSGCGDKPAAGEPIRAVRTFTVGAQAGATLRDYAAEIHARTESRIGFRVPGKMTDRPINAGDRVRPGQILARLDPADFRLSQNAAKAALGAAQVNHEQNAADFKRYEDLRAQGFISAADLERRHSALEAAKAQLDQALAQASMQANQARYAVLAADAAGVVTAVYADVGTVVAAGTAVVALAHDGARDAVFNVPEDQLPVFRKLQASRGPVRVSLWSHSGAPLQAVVREIAAVADPATRTFQVKASLPTGAAELGQTATVHVELAPADGLLRVPLQAVFGQRRGVAVGRAASAPVLLVP